MSRTSDMVLLPVKSRANRAPLGAVFGRLMVVGEPKKDRDNPTQIYVECSCECGNRTHVRVGCLTRGETRSCGCYAKEATAAAKTTHGGSRTALYSLWRGMHRRCNDPSNASYERYGMRGIRVCGEWSDFEVFKSWATANGYEYGLTIDRKNSRGNYEPGNCQWLSRSRNTAKANEERKAREELLEEQVNFLASILAVLLGHRANLAR